MAATPPIEVDSEIIRELILFVKEALTTIIINISTFDNLIASLPSDSSPTTPLVSEVDIPNADSLHTLRDSCTDFVRQGWNHFINLAYKITDPHKSSFQTIILDDPSFPDLILNSLKLPHQEIRENIILAIVNIVVAFPMVKKQFMAANLVGRMFETVDFVSLPLSEFKTLFALAKVIDCMFLPFGVDKSTQFEQYPLIRSSVFEPAKQFIIFFFNNSEKLVLDAEDTAILEVCICFIHYHIKNMELRSDERDPDFVSELVKMETRTMVEMENEENLRIVFESMLSRTREWKRDQRDRQKRREVRLREEGWDDGFELRVVGIEVDANQKVKDWPCRAAPHLTVLPTHPHRKAEPANLVFHLDNSIPIFRLGHFLPTADDTRRDRFDSLQRALSDVTHWEKVVLLQLWKEIISFHDSDPFATLLECFLLLITKHPQRSDKELSEQLRSNNPFGSQHWKATSAFELKTITMVDLTNVGEKKRRT
ncbi:hypothetical protein BLNAU_17703 [Blattamonas nauphoetae]|uniref:Uncharacterized protein n=1 Tax=Blattamonas nauphoetae TaxID=2049346 RepID=A0ABQ9X703_9EUKA|nr:hypothetical protein BLNAU_17703 [Blattamonas nauphoetae]